MHNRISRPTWTSVGDGDSRTVVPRDGPALEAAQGVRELAVDDVAVRVIPGRLTPVTNVKVAVQGVTPEVGLRRAR